MSLWNPQRSQPSYLSDSNCSGNSINSIYKTSFNCVVFLAKTSLMLHHELMQKVGSVRTNQKIIRNLYFTARRMVKIINKKFPELQVMIHDAHTDTLRISGHGRVLFVCMANLGINSSSNYTLLRDKNSTCDWLERFGLPTPKWVGIKKENQKVDFSYALSLAKETRFPVFVKPVRGASGQGVTKVTTEKELMLAAQSLLQDNDEIQIQAGVRGHDVRVLSYRDEVFFAYARQPKELVGDGASTVQQLLDAWQRQLKKQKRAADLTEYDDQINQHLAMSGLSRLAVPKPGQKFTYMAQANASAGGEIVEVTDMLHPSIHELAAEVNQKFGLEMCGLDLMIPDIKRSTRKTVSIIELNCSPGLRHFVRCAENGLARVDAFYERVLRDYFGIE